MNVFITGGSGFLGRCLIDKLITHGHNVTALVRSPESETIVTALGATAAYGDITDYESLRSGMTGADVVFHLAAWQRAGRDEWRMVEITNVSGTRNVLTLAHELNVSRIIYTSTIEIFGDTQGALADEEYYTDNPLPTHYERTKWQAYYQVALPLIHKGAPITIILPGHLYGPDDPSPLGDLMTRFYHDLPPFPVLPGPHIKFSYTHVEDVADGHILAWQKGKIGESYILAGPAVSLGEMVEYWARLLGKRPPLLHLTHTFMQPVSPFIQMLIPFIDLPPIFSAEATQRMGITYSAESTKAKSVLGWTPRSLRRGLLETFEHIAKQEPVASPPTNDSLSSEKKWALVALATAVLLTILWLIRSKNNRK